MEEVVAEWRRSGIPAEEMADDSGTDNSFLREAR
jgi:hypothetical protein